MQGAEETRAMRGREKRKAVGVEDMRGREK